MRTFVSGIGNYDLLIDRINGMTFSDLMKKYEMRNPTQARAYYQNTLAHIVHNSPKIKKMILKVLHSSKKNDNQDIRDKKIFFSVLDGMTYKDASIKYNLSKERIREIYYHTFRREINRLNLKIDHWMRVNEVRKMKNIFLQES